MNNQYTPQQKQDKRKHSITQGFEYDLQNIENKVAEEITKIVTTGGSTDPKSLGFNHAAIESLMNATSKKPIKGNHESITSFAEVETSIKKKLRKADIFPENERAHWLNKIEKKRQDLENTLNTQEGIETLILEDLKRTAIKNLIIIDNNGKVYDTAEDRRLLEQSIIKDLSFPREITLLLTRSNSTFAQTTLKNIIQKRIPEFFGPKDINYNSTTYSYKVDIAFILNEKKQKDFSEAVNEDIDEFIKNELIAT